MNLVCYYYTTQLYLKTFFNFLNIYIITKIFLKVKFLFMVPAGGVEPPTARVWTECSSQLSYTGICKYKLDHTHPTVLFHTPKPYPSVVCKALRSANHTFVLDNAREFLFFHPRVVGHYPHIFALFLYRPSVLLLIWMRFTQLGDFNLYLLEHSNCTSDSADLSII